MYRIIPAVIVAASTLVLGACASVGAADGRETVVEIEVDAAALPPGSLTISIASDLDPRQILGSVASGDEASFSFTARAAERYRMAAEATAGGTIESRRFAIPADTEMVTWDLSTNTVRVR